MLHWTFLDPNSNLGEDVGRTEGERNIILGYLGKQLNFQLNNAICIEVCIIVW